jgi:hypothetical protein
VSDVQERLGRSMTQQEESQCTALLEDAALLIDAYRAAASDAAKKAVSCRMVVRVLGDGGGGYAPAGATQGSVSALGYSQSWSYASGGGAGELYLSKSDKLMLGGSNAIGSYSPVEDLAPSQEVE